MPSLSLIAESQDDAAATLGVNTRTFARWLKRGCPGRPRQYIIADCIQWARENVWSEEGALIDGATGEDGDIKTEYLRQKIEKLRRENELADFKIGERHEQLIDVDVVASLLAEQSDVIRSAAERLERQYGSDAADLIIDALEELSSLDLHRDTTRRRPDSQVLVGL